MNQNTSPTVELAPDADPIACARRVRNFAVRAEPSRDPDFAGEKTVYTTQNGTQEYPTPLAPHEARKLFDLLAAEFGLTTAAEGALTDALREILYESKGRWYVGTHGDADVTNDLAPEAIAALARSAA